MTIGQRILAQYTEGGGVPRQLSITLPEDISQLPPQKRKQRFTKTLMPIILSTNSKIMKERATLLAITDINNLSALEDGFIRSLAEKYRLNIDETAVITSADRDELLLRVDIIPASLALAQGAIESGWGTSRFARLGNALYGEWVWNDEADGIVPENRREGASHRIRAFPALQASVASYIRNLNTHPAYANLREIRAKLRERNSRLSGGLLSNALTPYSSRREAYVKDVKSIIRRNGFESLDGLSLRLTDITQTTP